ncbi:GNAT family N-acetyltransferase [Nocardioides bruguierae]|uniref:GNAT family N-acetyltransferase n=1 Tax=Nocardioides bruguierae TaxID=2945102 RepID=UPI0020223CF7|nr:GNAT family N-acetyltransferase [Nocardioides bruguierae]MCL8027336.1 GNAT family N-acetyltransferase [Nocardioides bruguierae]
MLDDVQADVAGADDWSAFRDVRLRALRDAPHAFGTTLAKAEANPEQVWRERVRGPGPLLLARASRMDPPVGMAGLFVPPEQEQCFVWGVWVAPEVRGRGLAETLTRRLLALAPAERDVVLHVTEGNDVARRLYERLGFETTGVVEPLREGSALVVHEMLRLRTSRPGVPAPAR